MGAKKSILAIFIIIPLIGLIGCGSSGGSKNQLPVAIINVPSTKAYINQELTFDGSKSHDPDGGDLKFAWSINEDEAIGFDPKFTYQFAEDGEYTITLTVTDDEGSTGRTSVKTEILPVSPDEFIFDLTYTGSEPFNHLHPLVLIITMNDHSALVEFITAYENGVYSMDISEVYIPSIEYKLTIIHDMNNNWDNDSYLHIDRHDFYGFYDERYPDGVSQDSLYSTPLTLGKVHTVRFKDPGGDLEMVIY